MVDKRGMLELKGRVDEEYIFQQYQSVNFSEFFQEHKDRLEKVKQLVRGDWADLYPDGTDMPGDPLIENAAKSMLRDISGLAVDTKPLPHSIPTGPDQTDYKQAQVRESIAKTLWDVNNGPRIEKRLHMDVIWAGMAVLACAAPKGSQRDRMPYATMTRLKPDRCWPDVVNGSLQDLVYIERVKLRQAARMYPNLGMVPPDNTEFAELMDYYNDESVTRAVIIPGAGQDGIKVVDQWYHELGCVPVAFTQLDSIDEAFRGMLDQAAPGLLSRNRIFQYLMDYIYDMVHAPYEEKNIRNWQDAPGPDTVYHHDPSDPNSFMRRVPPAAPAPAVFGIAQYMEGQASGEMVQPPSRQGDVRQSVASASFVGATQGRLTTLVKDLHDGHSDMRQQAQYICSKIEEQWLDEKKPLYYPVGKQRTYTPSKDINGWYHMKFTYGVAAGVDRQTADQRLLAHRGAKAISLETYRDQLEFVDDSTGEQRKIDLEDTMDAFKQRVLMDPRFPLSVVANIMHDLKTGDDLEAAANKYIPELQQADLAAQQNGAPGGEAATAPETPGIGGPQPPTNGPNAIPQEGQTPPPDIQLQPNPNVQQFIGQ